MYRPSPLVRAYCLEEKLQTPAKIYYKLEGNNTSGSHKLNSAIAQAYYAKQQGPVSYTHLAHLIESHGNARTLLERPDTDLVAEKRKDGIYLYGAADSQYLGRIREQLIKAGLDGAVRIVDTAPTRIAAYKDVYKRQITARCWKKKDFL